jgi:hypothetical protein
MTTKAELRRLDNLRKQQHIESIVWSQDKVNSLTADFTKTIGTLTGELNRMHNERTTFLYRLSVEFPGYWNRICDIQKECFK